MSGQLGKRLVKACLLNDVRGITVILLGACIYLILFSTFGHPEISSITLEPSHAFPRKLWQLWKTDPVRFDEKMAQRVRTWTKENPTLRYEVLSDANALAYVKQTFGPHGFNRPDIVSTYQDLTATIVKADFLRYLIMYAEGGIYADVDVEAIEPFDDWIPRHFQEHDLDMIVGVETDQPEFRDHRLLGVKSQSFCQWTFASKRRAPAMMRLINNIVRWLRELKRSQDRELPNLSFDFDTVLNITGPSAFTSAILAEMSASAGHTIDWDEFHRLRDAKVVERILVLPAQAFAAATGHSESGSHHSMGALVRHYFGASGWTKEHQRYKHPAYGSVEKCNWNAECVRLWDANTATFDALSEQEQLDFLANLQASEKAPPQAANDQQTQEGETSEDTGANANSDETDQQQSDSDQEASPPDSNGDATDLQTEVSDADTEGADESAHDEAIAEIDVDHESGTISDNSFDSDIKYEIPNAATLETLLTQEQYDIADATTLEKLLMDDT